MTNHTARSSLPLASAAHGQPTPSSERRRGERVRTGLQILLKGASEGDVVQMRSLDVSRGGIFVAAKEPLELGTLVRLRRADALGVDGVGRVVWVRGPGQCSPDEQPGMGIKFVKLSEQSRADLEQLANSPHVEVLGESHEMRVAEVSPVSTSVLVRAAIPCGQGGAEQLQEGPGPVAVLPQTHTPREGAPIPREGDVEGSARFAGDGPVRAPAGDLFQAVLAQMTQAALAARNQPDDASPPDEGEPSPTRGHTMVCAYVEAPAPEQLHAAAIGVEALPVRSTVRHGALAMAGMCALGALGWALWPSPSAELLASATHAATAALPAKATAIPPPPAIPEPPSSAVVRVTTQPEGAEIFVGDSSQGHAPLEIQLTGDAPVTLSARAPGHKDAQVQWTPGHSEKSLQIELAKLPYILHVETSPPGARLRVAGQHDRAPADFELPNYDGKRLVLTVRAQQREEHVVYVSPGDFVAHDDAIRANVKVRLKHTGGSEAGAESSSEQAATQAVGAAPAAPAPE